MIDHVVPLHRVETNAVSPASSKLSYVSLIYRSTKATRFPRVLSSSLVSRPWTVTGDGLCAITPALIDYRANNADVIELSGTASICFLHYDIELQQAD